MTPCPGPACPRSCSCAGPSPAPRCGACRQRSSTAGTWRERGGGGKGHGFAADPSGKLRLETSARTGVMGAHAAVGRANRCFNHFCGSGRHRPASGTHGSFIPAEDSAARNRALVQTWGQTWSGVGGVPVWRRGRSHTWAALRQKFAALASQFGLHFNRWPIWHWAPVTPVDAQLQKCRALATLARPASPHARPLWPLAGPNGGEAYMSPSSAHFEAPPPPPPPPPVCSGAQP